VQHDTQKGSRIHCRSASSIGLPEFRTILDVDAARRVDETAAAAIRNGLFAYCEPNAKTNVNRYLALWRQSLDTSLLPVRMMDCRKEDIIRK
jgi:hypothetical protein